jgi:cytochrome c biogenesis protein CcmG, thiol:disulfide interchange protein DsbE
MLARRFLWLMTLLVAAAALLVVLRHGHQPVHRPAEQSALPPADFPMKQLDGAPLRLSDYRGKVLLIDFWASWCPPCRKEIPHLVAWQDKYGGRGLQVIGIAMDDNPETAEKFSREFKMNYPVVAGSAKLAERFGGVLGLPVNIVIGRDGRVISKHLGEVDLSTLEHELITQLALKPS